MLLTKVSITVQGSSVSAGQWGEAVPSPCPIDGTLRHNHILDQSKILKKSNRPSISQFPATHDQIASFLSWHSFKILVMAHLLGDYWLSTVLLEGSRCFASNFSGKCYLQLCFSWTLIGEHTKHNVGWSHAMPWLFKNSVTCWWLLLSHQQPISKVKSALLCVHNVKLKFRMHGNGRKDIKWRQKVKKHRNICAGQTCFLMRSKELPRTDPFVGPELFLLGC